MATHKPAAYVCTCTAAQISAAGCDCTAERVRVIEVGTAPLDNGLFVLTFDGAIRGDCAKFSEREAYAAAASWDGKESGEWVGGEWRPAVYRCAWGAKRAA